MDTNSLVLQKLLDVRFWKLGFLNGSGGHWISFLSRDATWTGFRQIQFNIFFQKNFINELFQKDLIIEFKFDPFMSRIDLGRGKLRSGLQTDKSSSVRETNRRALSSYLGINVNTRFSDSFPAISCLSERGRQAIRVHPPLPSYRFQGLVNRLSLS